MTERILFFHFRTLAAILWLRIPLGFSQLLKQHFPISTCKLKRWFLCLSNSHFFLITYFLLSPFLVSPSCNPLTHSPFPYFYEGTPPPTHSLPSSSLPWHSPTRGHQAFITSWSKLWNIEIYIWFSHILKVYHYRIFQYMNVIQCFLAHLLNGKLFLSTYIHF